MTFPPDNSTSAAAALTADWVTIWQSELSALAADREQAEHAAAMLAAWLAATEMMRRHDRSSASTRSMSSGADAPRADAPRADAPRADAPRADAPRADAPSRAPAAAAAPAAGDALARLEQRLAELERRLDAVVAPDAAD